MRLHTSQRAAAAHICSDASLRRRSATPERPAPDLDVLRTAVLHHARLPVGDALARLQSTIGNQHVLRLLHDARQTSGVARAPDVSVTHPATPPSGRFAGNVRLEAASRNEPPVMRGESGDAVIQIQQALLDDGFDMPISTRGGTVPADGVFGEETLHAVTGFQAKYGLQQDGRVGHDTLARLDQVPPHPSPDPPGPLPPLPIPVGRGMVLHLTGVSLPEPPPDGYQAVLGKAHELFAAGWTGIKTSDSGFFQKPDFNLTHFTQKRRENGVWHDYYFARVLGGAVAKDADHESVFVGAGDHHFGGKLSFIRFTDDISALVKKGEEEHLSDARRAFLLTYQLVADEINKLKDREFKSTRSLQDADKMAEAELAAHLPKALGASTRQWELELRELLGRTHKRDDQHWHEVETPDKPIKEGKKTIFVVRTTGRTNIGSVGSDQVVNY